MSDLQAQIEEMWAGRADLSVDDAGANATIHAAIDLLDTGQARVAEPDGSGGVGALEWA